MALHTSPTKISVVLLENTVMRSSQWVPGYLGRRREGAEPNPYYIGARDYWNSGLLLTLEDWLKKHDVPQ